VISSASGTETRANQDQTRIMTITSSTTTSNKHDNRNPGANENERSAKLSRNPEAGGEAAELESADEKAVPRRDSGGKQVDSEFVWPIPTGVSFGSEWRENNQPSTDTEWERMEDRRRERDGSPRSVCVSSENLSGGRPINRKLVDRKPVLNSDRPKTSAARRKSRKPMKCE